MRIFFTGGSGKAGRHVLPVLAAAGHRITNFDQVPLDAEGVHNIQGDMTDAGQVWSALTMPSGWDDLETPGAPPAYDAAVHFAAIPRNMLRSDQDTFRINVMGQFNVMEAASGLGIRKIVFASSETTYGICFAAGERRPDYVPVDEDHPTIPEDTYAMSKTSGETMAKGFQQRTGADVYGLRINNVIEPHEYAEIFPAFAEDPSLRRRNIFAYIDARDLGLMVDCCLKTDGLGYQVFNVANPDTSVDIPSSEIIDRFYEGVEVKRPLEGRETFYAIDKARRLVGFDPKERWKDEMGG